MADRPRIALFCEDRGHEQFVRALLGRLARDVGLSPIVLAPSARGGHARALGEFQLWQDAFLGEGRSGVPSLLVLVIDCNCSPWQEVRQELEDAIDKSLIPHCVVGCPDPHVERWYMADPVGFQRVVGVRPGKDPGKCERQLYKRLVEDAVAEAGLPLLTGIPDLALDLVAAMDLFRAGKNQPSFRHFADQLRGVLRLLAEG